MWNDCVNRFTPMPMSLSSWQRKSPNKSFCIESFDVKEESVLWTSLYVVLVKRLNLTWCDPQWKKTYLTELQKYLWIKLSRHLWHLLLKVLQDLYVLNLWTIVLSLYYNGLFWKWSRQLLFLRFFPTSGSFCLLFFMDPGPEERGCCALCRF